MMAHSHAEDETSPDSKTDGLCCSTLWDPLRASNVRFPPSHIYRQ